MSLFRSVLQPLFRRSTAKLWSAKLRSAKLRTTKLQTAKLSALIVFLVIASTMVFAAPPDRILAPIVTGSTASLGSGLRAHPWAQYDQGPVEASFPLRNLAFRIAPTPSQEHALETLLAQQQDRNSPNYHKWLTPEQYAARFGLSPNDIKKITDWLQSEGFTAIRVARASNMIMFSGTAEQVERTFQTQIHRYQVNGQSQFYNVTPPQIPAALSGIVSGMRGLNNYHMKSALQRMKRDYFAGSDGNPWDNDQFLSPGDIYAIYNIPTSMNGSGQSLAIIGETDILAADLADFQTGFGFTETFNNCTSSEQAPGVITSCNIPNFQYVLYLPTGDTDPLVPDALQSGDLGEADLDIEYSGATAPSAKVIYVNAPATDGNGVVDSMSYAIDQKIAPVVSMSYGLCEFFSAENTAEGFVGFSDSEFMEANSFGMTIVNSSDDEGDAGCDGGANEAAYGYQVEYPASSPYVTAVGGTSIPYTEYTSTYWGQSNGPNGGTATGYIPEQSWDDSEEFSIYCTNNPTVAVCKDNVGLNSWSEAQEDYIGISGGGSGVSNCLTVNVEGICTTAEPQPSFQSGLNTSVLNPSGTGELDASTPTRYVPDVALLASPGWPGYIWCTPNEEIGGDNWTSSCVDGIPGAIADGSTAGGTSFAAPIFAGIITLLNQYLVTNGVESVPGLANINPTVYSLAATAGAFNPVTTANTGSYSNGMWCEEGQPAGQPTPLLCPSSGQGAGFLGGFDTYNFDPTTNYNLVTGLGSVNVNNFVLAWFASEATQFTLASTGSSSQTVLAGQTTPAAYTFTATPVSGSTFAKAVIFGCSFSPADPTLTNTSCTFIPSSIAAGQPTSSVTLSIKTVGPNPPNAVRSQQRRRADNRLPWLPLSLPLAGIVFAGFAGRKTSRRSAVAGLCVSLILLGLVVACGGGSSSPPIGVTVSPQSATMYPNDSADNWPSQTQTFAAVVTNTTNTNVTWAVTTPNSGTINSNGVYTAPTVATGLPTSATITATSQADETKVASATVNIMPATVPGTYQVTVTATQGQTAQTQTVQLTVQ
jgi:Pro-kumamolisin, activation domain